MKNRTRSRWTAVVWAMGVAGLLLAPLVAQATNPELKGKFEILKDETSTHQPGKVKVIEFADFYCPHCHHFEETGVPLLLKEFGNRVEVTMVGFPVIPGNYRLPLICMSRPS
mgnify:FL=1